MSSLMHTTDQPNANSEMAAVELAYDLFDIDVDPGACPIILMHGFFWNKFMFKDIANRLSQEMKCKVYSLDSRDHGKSPSTKNITMALMVEDLKKFMQDRGIGKANFVCHSMSSSTAYLYLLNEPDKVQKIVMIDCPPFCSEKEVDGIALAYEQVTMQNNMLRMLDATMTLRQAKEKFNNLATKGLSNQKYFFKKAAHDLTKVNGEFKWKIDFEFLLQMYDVNHFIEKARGSSNHEILVLRCVDSKLIWDEKFEGILKHNPRAKLVTFKNATHLLMFDRTEVFIEVVKEFLGSPSDGLETRRTV